MSTTALGIPRTENVEMIGESIAYAVQRGREALFDAEHFFDGYKANPSYALDCLKAAYQAGARWVVLCDTNGGTLPHEVERIVGEIVPHVPATGSPSIATTTPRTRSPTRWPRCAPARARSKAR